MESSKDTGCRAPEGPILCINNCDLFGNATTMNMCSKCHKDMIVLKQDQAKLAAASIKNIVNGSLGSDEKENVVTDAMNAQVKSAELKVVSAELKVVSAEASSGLTSQSLEVKPKEGPNKCTTCRKRVGLTGFSCKCGNLFCAVHRYSDKHEHDCPFDYRNAGRDCLTKK